MKLAAIINPKAGSRAGRDRSAIEHALRERHPDIEILHTARAHHATELAARAIRNGVDTIVAIGGDGTYNEVANGFFDGHSPINPDASLALIPDGSGSDLARLIGIRTADAGIDAIAKGVPLAIDVGRCEFTGRDGEAVLRYFINIADWGSGGEVAERVNHGSRFPGKLGYLHAIIMALLSYKPKKMRVVVDGEEFEDVFSSVIVANGQYFGNGIHVAPKARLTNGTMEVFLIRDMPVLKSFSLLPKLYDGSFVELTDYVIARRAKEICSECGEAVHLDFDGEAPGRLSITLTTVPRALNLIVPRDYFEAAPEASMTNPSEQS